jgi:hypothetical protein
MEPKPMRPSRGSGEAVCGSFPFPPSFFAVVLLSAAAPADWSLLADALLSAEAAPVVLEADWSAEGVVELAADWSAAGGVVLAAPDADWSAEGVLAEAAPAAGALVVVLLVVVWLCSVLWVAEGVLAEAEPAGVVAEAEAEGEVALVEAADWSALAGAEGCGGGAVVLPVPEAEAAVVSAVGFAPLSAEGAAAPVLDWLADWSELGMVLLAEAEGAAAPEGAAPLAVVVVVVVVCVAAAPEAGAAEEAPVVLQDSEIIFMSETLNLLSEPIVPVNEAWCPTWASRPLPSSL